MGMQDLLNLVMGTLLLAIALRMIWLRRQHDDLFEAHCKLSSAWTRFVIQQAVDQRDMVQMPDTAPGVPGKLVDQT